jgi:hypothetical protein
MYFGDIPPNSTVERQEGFGKTLRGWQIGGITIDGQTYPMNQSLGGNFGGGGFWRKLFSAPSV